MSDSEKVGTVFPKLLLWGVSVAILELFGKGGCGSPQPNFQNENKDLSLLRQAFSLVSIRFPSVSLGIRLTPMSYGKLGGHYRTQQKSPRHKIGTKRHKGNAGRPQRLSAIATQPAVRRALYCPRCGAQP